MLAAARAGLWRRRPAPGCVSQFRLDVLKNELQAREGEQQQAEGTLAAAMGRRPLLPWPQTTEHLSKIEIQLLQASLRPTIPGLAGAAA